MQGDVKDRVRELGQYPTRVWVAEALVKRYFPNLDSGDLVVEPACGPGAFLGAIPVGVPAVGVELDATIAEIARRETGRRVVVGDFRTVRLDCRPSVILGNPPFNLRVIDGFLERAHQLLPDGGRVGFILPAYAFQTAGRVAAYADRWSIAQEMIPRNIYEGLSLPLVFALFSKDRRRTLVGFALYRETADIQKLGAPYREVLSAGNGPVWARVVERALAKLGGEADLAQIYAEIEGKRPTQTQYWREQVRKVVRTHRWFSCVSAGRYALNPAAVAAA
ncbi:class I SAM-dependent methyltransferase [Burkholderia ubonensis]|uniref:class I SAM-dependent methyltransferase n=1 Tax=Burkholderia ubonensis TaxID=101571 RepID=UPI0007537766|nr:class I SAM-dependent methyltransferase [Burkholderia ubonensis]KVV07335.1 DNA methyltransferase [Burkholderia ubonensis]